MDSVIESGASGAVAAGKAEPESCCRTGRRFRWMKALLFLAIAAIPFDCIRGGASYVLRMLPVYFLVPAVLVVLPEIFRLVRRTKHFWIFSGIGAVFLFWGIAASCAASGFSTENLMRYSAFAKAVVLWFGIGCSYAALFLLLTENDRIRILRGAVCVLVGICALHAAIEFLWIFGVPGAERMLVEISESVRSVRLLSGWWPPAVWPEYRIRAWFAEPSYCAVMMVYCILILTADFLQNRKTVSLCFAIAALVILVPTYSRTGYLLLLIGGTAAIGILAVGKQWAQWIGAVKIALLFFLIFCTLFLLLRRTGGGSGGGPDAGSNRGLKEEMNGQFVSGGSTSTRLFLVTVNLQAAREHLLFGGGAGAGCARVLEILRSRDPDRIPREVSDWVKRGDIPSANIYMDWLSDFGIVGCLPGAALVLFPLLLLLRSLFLSGAVSVFDAAIFGCGAVFLAAPLGVMYLYFFSAMFAFGVVFSHAVSRESQSGCRNRSC